MKIIRQIKNSLFLIANDIESFIEFHAILFRIFKGTCRRVQRGDLWGGAFEMACDEEERKMDEELLKMDEDLDRDLKTLEKKYSVTNENHKKEE